MEPMTPSSSVVEKAVSIRIIGALIGVADGAGARSSCWRADAVQVGTRFVVAKKNQMLTKTLK